ncbi:GNAT family N-acetyltransferase [Candidatus Poribacteria bacterium]|nr:GNAT family N-acetyltransferase [Candidatus Poribacteria bacterium]
MPDSKTSLGFEATVSLREITQETVNSILNLRVAKAQEQFVASNAVSIAQAYFSEEAWFRAIYADETPVGFLMLSDQPDKGEYYLWRFMVDAQHQGKGYGRRALELLIEHVKTRPNAKEFFLSHVPGPGSPEGFYRQLGFEHTGEKAGEELVMKLTLH